MAEPVGTGVATAALTGVTIIGLLTGVDAGVLIGAFAGAVIFVMSSNDMMWIKKLLLFGVSWLIGIVSAPFVASLITWATPDGIHAREPIGALIAAAIAVRLLMSLSANPMGFLERLRKGGSDDK